MSVNTLIFPVLRGRDYVHVCFDQTDFVVNKSHFGFEGIIRQVLDILGRSLDNRNFLGTFGVLLVLWGKFTAMYEVQLLSGSHAREAMCRQTMPLTLIF